MINELYDNQERIGLETSVSEFPSVYCDMTVEGNSEQIDENLPIRQVDCECGQILNNIVFAPPERSKQPDSLLSSCQRVLLHLKYDVSFLIDTRANVFGMCVYC